MTSAPITAENYHLKWDSHLMHLNLSVASLYKHDRYADVMLLSSHPDCLGGPGVPAHKIILSASSKFFASIFELTPYIPSHNGLMYLVLPPELSRRAIQVLVQYMYSGESTVSNDILSEVLNGGELLKIRGLYRGSTSASNKNMNLMSSFSNISSSSSNQKSTIVQNAASPAESTKLSDKNTLGAKQSSKIVIQHTKSLAATTLPERPTGLTIKKDLAIDPDFRNSVVLSPTCNNMQCTIKTAQTEPQSLLSVTTDFTPHDTVERRKSRIGSNFSDCLLQIKEEPIDSCSEKSHPISYDLRKNKRIESKTPTKSLNNELIIDDCDIKVQSPVLSEFEDNSMSYVSDCFDDKMSSSNEQPDSELKKKPEPICYVPKKKRKMETESTDEKKKPMQNCIIVQKVKTNKNVDETSSLTCDICELVIKSAGDWVRHMQQYHTETELAISNQKLKTDKTKATVSTYGGCVRIKKVMSSLSTSLSKTCNFCAETFPSYKDMVLHVRKHHSKEKNY